MIHVDLSGEEVRTEINGKGIQIMAELSAVVAALSKGGVGFEDIIDSVIAGLALADEELEKLEKAKAENGTIEDRQKYVSNLLKGLANE